MWPLWLWVVLTAGTLFLLHGFHIPGRWRLRHLPAVQPTPFLLGHLKVVRKTQLFVAYERWARRYGGIFLLWFGKDPVVVLTDPELIRQVMVKDFSKFHDRIAFLNSADTRDKRMRVVQSGVIIARGGYWASLRSALQPLFHSAALASYSGIMGDAADRLVARVGEAARGGGPVLLHTLAGRMTMEVIGRTAFGVEFIGEGGEADIAAGVPNLVAAASILIQSAGVATGLGAAFRLLPQWMEPLLFNILLVHWGKRAQRVDYARTSFASTADLLMKRAEGAAAAAGRTPTMVHTDWRWWPADSAFVTRNPYRGVEPEDRSVLSMLMQATNKETGAGLTDLQIAAQCPTLITAGYETSSNALAFAVHLLATHPKAEAALLAEVDAFGRDRTPTYDDLASLPYTRAVLHESMRLYPPAPLTTRTASVDTYVGSHFIPKGTWVHINIWGLHHDPQHWPEPNAFRPERFLPEEAAAADRHPNAFMPFGLGPRMCIGWKFAEEELVIALVRLYQAFTFSLPPCAAGKPLPLRFGVTLAPDGGLPVIAHPR